MSEQTMSNENEEEAEAIQGEGGEDGSDQHEVEHSDNESGEGEMSDSKVVNMKGEKLTEEERSKMEEGYGQRTNHETAQATVSRAEYQKLLNAFISEQNLNRAYSSLIHSLQNTLTELMNERSGR